MFFFNKFSSHQCCLCGESAKLTGEHKIKASTLRDEFGKRMLCIGQNILHLRLAQSSQSKRFKFKTRICEACNTDRTQQADREFDRFNRVAHEIIINGNDSAFIFQIPRYIEGSEPYLNLFRYFSKLLCCQMAEANAPCLKRLSDFAIGRSETNYVGLSIRNDQTYINISKLINSIKNDNVYDIGNLQYAAHGGLSVYGDESSGIPYAFSSTLTIGSIQYVFYMNLAEEEKYELEMEYPEFFERCRAQLKKAMR